MAARIEKVFDAPGPQPNGMQATEEGLWILDQQTNQASLVGFDGSVRRTLDTTSDRGSGITVGGGALWIASTYSREILKVNPATGKTLAAFATPGAAATGAHGLEWRAGRLWMAVPPSATVYEVAVEKELIVLRSFPAPGGRPHGIAWVGDDLWCVETSHRVIYRLGASDGAILGTIDVPAPYPEPHGMTFWKENFWYCDAVSGAICRVIR